MEGELSGHYLDSPLGKIHIVCSKNGLTKIKFVKNYQDEVPVVTNFDKEPCITNQHLKSTIEWLEIYFEEPDKLKNMEAPILDLSRHANKTFITHVWQVLKNKVPPGVTVSYGELAKMCGSPKAARAVGQAMRTNPFTILVPCHRVVNADGKLGNYSSGVDKKKWLLNHEGREF